MTCDIIFLCPHLRRCMPVNVVSVVSVVSVLSVVSVVSCAMAHLMSLSISFQGMTQTDEIDHDLLFI